MKVVLLAAGFATRMYPLTRERAKPLLEVAGRPILSHLLDRVLEITDLSSIVVVTNHRFVADFERWRDAAGATAPIRVVDDGSTSDADKRGAIADLRLALAGTDTRESFLVIAGDNLIDFSLASLASTFRESGRALLVLRTIEGEVPPRRHGEVTLDEHGRVIRFREKPADPRTRLTATCIYFFPPEVHALLDRYLEEGQDPDAPGYFIEWLIGRLEVDGRPFDGRWFDIGNLGSYAQAQREWTRR